MLALEDVIEALDETVDRFGSATYYSEGPERLMELDSLNADLRLLSPSACAELLNGLYEHPHGHILVGRLLERQEDRADFSQMLAALTDEIRADNSRRPKLSDQEEPSAIQADAPAGSIGLSR